MGSRRDDGTRAEDLAARHLERLGYRLLHRNYQVRSGELDLVVRAPDGTLCFVEVRARADVAHGRPGETVTFAKQRRVIAAARAYLAAHVRGEEPACRFDVVEIIGALDAAVPPRVEHIPDAFRLPDS
jgi:putative endonuclease